MGALQTIPEQLTTAQINGHSVQVHQGHRQWADPDCPPGPGGDVGHEPVLVTVTLPVSLSVDDVTAVLFDWNYPDADLDDHTVRQLVAGMVLNWGCFHLTELRTDLANRILDEQDTAYLAHCRARAVAVFGTGAVSCPVPGRVLAVVR